MHRIDNALTVPVLPAPRPDTGKQGYFTNGDPARDIPSTDVDDDWLNAVQEEICNVIAEAGIDLDKTRQDQLLQALNKLYITPAKLANALSLLDFVTDDELADALEPLDFVVETWAASDGSAWYRKYKSGWVEQGGNGALASGSSVNVTTNFPIAFANTNYAISVIQLSDFAGSSGDSTVRIRERGTTFYRASVSVSGNVYSIFYACGQGVST